jgi:hypothetical protein
VAGWHAGRTAATKMDRDIKRKDLGVIFTSICHY